MSFVFFFQDELDDVKNVWNSHRIRRNPLCHLPCNRPNALYGYPELWGSASYLHPVTIAELQATSDGEVIFPTFPCDTDIYDLCCDIMRSEHLSMPEDSMQMVSLYLRLHTTIHRLLR